VSLVEPWQMRRIFSAPQPLDAAPAKVARPETVRRVAETRAPLVESRRGVQALYPGPALVL
jgi:hypothetical protein